MKAFLEFDLPSEQEAYDDAVRGMVWRSVVHQLDEKLRGWIKYGHEFKTADEVLETVRRELLQLVEDDNLNLYN